MDDYVAINRASWDERAPAHAESPDYAVDRFVEDPEFLSGVVSFDRARLGDLAGLTGVHLQCHIGTDTISLARLGASMTGLDFSAESLVQARALAERIGSPTQFVQSEVYRALDVLPAGSFDLVYTGIGALCWLPDINRLGGDRHRAAAPRRQAVHPRDASDARHARRAARMSCSSSRIRTSSAASRPSGPRAGPTSRPTTYSTPRQSVEWSHGLGETVTALLDAGMQLTQLAEHDSVPWPALPSQMTCDDHGEWRLTDRPWRLAASFTLEAIRA